MGLVSINNLIWIILMKKWKTFKYLGSLLTNQNAIQDEIKCEFKAGNSCYYSAQTHLSFRLLSKNFNIKIYKIEMCTSCRKIRVL